MILNTVLNSSQIIWWMLVLRETVGTLYGMIFPRRSWRILQLPELTEQAMEEIPLRGKICQPGASQDAQNHPLHFQGL